MLRKYMQVTETWRRCLNQEEVNALQGRVKSGSDNFSIKIIDSYFFDNNEELKQNILKFHNI